MTAGAKRGALQRKCDCGGSCEKCSGDLLRWRANERAPGSVPPMVHDVLRSPGQPLDAATRMAMEPRFGRDFSKVRVHADAHAAQSAAAVNALAYASGNHIVAGEASLPRHVLVHELAHVAQHRGGDAMPQRIASADSPAELEADRAAASATPVSHAEENALHRYRKKNAFNFPGVFEELLEEEFTDSATQPWIETIKVVFDSTFVNGEGRHVPLGNLTANYHASKLPAIEFKISGGEPKFDLTSITTGNKVDRIEGHGYNDKPFAEGKGEGPKNKYAKEDPATGMKFASMHYAVFFKAGQAIHLGDLAVGSHACVHADPGTERRMAQLNFHSVKGLTTVTTSYDAVTQFVSCCDLFKHREITKKGVAKNPCHDSDPTWCPHLW